MSATIKKQQQQMQDIIEPEMAVLPRFIFRFWHDLSGGYSGINTPTTITPSAFSSYNTGEHPPQYMHQLSKKDIRRIANKHIGAKAGEHTVFSSWSQSILTVLRMAQHAEDHGKRNIHISILDTTLLGESNVVLHTVQMKKLKLCNISYCDELLAYGIISGPAYQAVPFANMKGLLSSSGTFSQNATVAGWQKLVSVFHPKFRLAVTAFLVTMYTPDVDKIYERALLVRILAGLEVPAEFEQDVNETRALLRSSEALGRLEVPHDWQHDRKIMNVEGSVLQGLKFSTEANAAAAVIRVMVMEDTARRTEQEKEAIPLSPGMQKRMISTRAMRTQRRRLSRPQTSGVSKSRRRSSCIALLRLVQESQQTIFPTALQQKKEKSRLRALKQLSIGLNPKHFAPVSARSMRGIVGAGSILAQALIR